MTQPPTCFTHFNQIEVRKTDLTLITSVKPKDSSEIKRQWDFTFSDGLISDSRRFSTRNGCGNRTDVHETGNPFLRCGFAADFAERQAYLFAERTVVFRQNKRVSDGLSRLADFEKIQYIVSQPAGYYRILYFRGLYADPEKLYLGK